MNKFLQTIVAENYHRKNNAYSYSKINSEPFVTVSNVFFSVNFQREEK